MYGDMENKLQRPRDGLLREFCFDGELFGGAEVTYRAGVMVVEREKFPPWDYI